MFSTPGRDSDITAAPEISTPQRKSWLDIEGFFPATSRRFASCQALAATRQTQSRRLLSIDRSQLSKRIARVCSHGCSTCAPRWIPRSAAKNCGKMPRNLSQNGMQRFSTPRLSIWVHSFACRTNRNAGFVRLRNSVAQRIRKYCRSRNPNHAQSSLSRITRLCFVAARSCSNEPPRAGGACGFCRRLNLTAVSGQVPRDVAYMFRHFRSRITGSRLLCIVARCPSESLGISGGLDPLIASQCLHPIAAQRKPSSAQEKQRDHAGSSRQNRDGNPNARVVSKTDLEMIGGDEHHAQQQYQRVVIDGTVSALWCHYAGGNH